MEISTTVVNEEGTAAIQCSFVDEAGGAVVPLTLTWTLTDRQGTVINSREDVVVSSLAATISIVLSGDDLAFLDGEDVAEAERVITLKGTYNSTYGDDLPLVYEVLFYVHKRVNA